MIYDNDDLVEYDARVYRANANNYVRLETANPDDYEYFSITDYDSMRKIPRHHDCINPYNAARSSFGQQPIQQKVRISMNHFLIIACQFIRFKISSALSAI